MHRLTAARGSLEAERSDRLHKLVGVLQDIHKLEGPDRQRASRLLHGVKLEEIVDPSLPSLSPKTPKSNTKSVKAGTGVRKRNDIISLVPSPLAPATDDDTAMLRHVDQGLSAITDSDFSSDTAWGAEHNVKDESDVLRTPVSTVPPIASCGDSVSLLEEQMADASHEPSPTSDSLAELESEDRLDLESPPPDEIGPARDPPLDPPLTPISQETIPSSIVGSLPESTLEETIPRSDSSAPSELADKISHDNGDLSLPIPSPRELVLTIQNPFLRGLAPPAKDIPATLASLYSQYRNSVSIFAALSVPVALPPSTDPTEQFMTKAQYELTLEEGKLWDELPSSSLLSSDNEPDIGSSLQSNITEETLARLAHKSSVMSESYERRTNPPTADTYIESKTILQAMGIPCLDSTGAFEAEALASSLVINGIADYVASEDTVCTLLLPHLSRSRLSLPYRMSSFTKHL